MGVLPIAIAAYVAGLILCLLALRSMMSSEPTAHGQSIILAYGCVFTIFWPLLLIWIVTVGVITGAVRLWRAIRRSRGDI